MPETPTPALNWSWLRTPAAKVVMILALLLVMLIPLDMVSNLIAERQDRQEQTLTGFQHDWGPDQTIAGPLLVVPYVRTDPVKPTNSASAPARVTAYLRIPASQLTVQIKLDPQVRRRGLFHAAIYTAGVTLRGTIRIPDLTTSMSASPPGDADIDWLHGRLVFGASDLRGLPADSRLTWKGASVPLSGAERQGECSLSLFDAAAGLTAPRPGTTVGFETTLFLRGTQAFHVQPVGGDVAIQITSPWDTPSYIGASLPTFEAPEKSGFTAQWGVSGDAESAYWQQRGWAMPNCMEPADKAFFDPDRTVGVVLQEAVPTYLMVSRAQKYGLLFLALSFLTLFLFEALACVRIHVVQYGLLGLSVSLFSLMLISIAEPLGFAAGYALSTAAVLGQATLYTLSVTRQVRLAATFGGVLGSLFGFLYVVLSLDAYALLAGTVALFTVLSVVMVVTRRVNWDGAAGVA